MRKFNLIVASVLIGTMLFSLCSCKKEAEPSITGPIGSMLDFQSAEDGDTVTFEGYVQDKEALWSVDGKTSCSFYVQTDVGGAYVYEAPMSEETYNALTDGVLVRVQGTKSTWSNLPEITNAIVEVVGGLAWSAPRYEIKNADIPSSALSTRVSVNDATVVKMTSGNIIEYGYNNQGGRGDNISFLVKIDGVDIPCSVDTHLTGASSACYATAEALKEGSSVSVNGILSVRGNEYFVLVTDITVK